MKLAEALQLRADIMKRISQMPVRLSNNATVQEGSLPAEKPEDLLSEMESLCRSLEKLTTTINLTNASTFDQDGVSLTALMARRDSLRTESGMMRDFLNEASAITPRRMSTDIRILPSVDVAQLRKRCDSLSKKLRETDTAIQTLNWTTEIPEV